MDVIFLYIMNGNIVDMKNVFQRKIINYQVVAAETFYILQACVQGYFEWNLQNWVSIQQ